VRILRCGRLPSLWSAPRVVVGGSPQAGEEVEQHHAGIQQADQEGLASGHEPPSDLVELPHERDLDEPLQARNGMWTTLNWQQ